MGDDARAAAAGAGAAEGAGGDGAVELKGARAENVTPEEVSERLDQWREQKQRSFGLIGLVKPPEPCQVACPYCRTAQDAKPLPAECDECGRRFGKTAPIRRKD